MATHSSILAWRIPGTGEPGGLPSTGSHRVGHDWSDSAAAVSCHLQTVRVLLLIQSVVVQSRLTLCNPMDCNTPGFTVCCPSLSPRVCSNSCPLSQWCHATISSCRPLLLLPSIIPSIRVFSNQLGLPPCGHSIGVSVSASVLPMNIQGWFSLELTGLFFLFSKGLSRVFSRTIVQKHPFFGTQFLYGSTLTSILMEVTNGKTVALTIQTFDGKVISLLLNSQSRFVITFLPRSKCLLISWLQSLSSVILDLKKIKSVTVSIFSPSTCHELMGLDAMIFIFWMLSFKPAFPLSSFILIQRLFSSSLLSAIRVVSSAYPRLLMFFLAIFFLFYFILFLFS